MILRKWNYDTHKYDDYEIPKDWNVKTYSDDMDEIVNCPHCGKQIKFGDGYTSMEIHTSVGFGYCVCHECYYDKEWVRRRNAKEN